jgi:hypothetical protein
MGTIDWATLIRENLVGFLIGTVFLGTIFDLIRRGIDYLINKPYRNWVLEVTPADADRATYTHDLLWDEVRRFKESRFECRKFIQSVCSSENVRLRMGEIPTDQPDFWVYRDDDAKKYRFDFRKKQTIDPAVG